MQIIVRVEGSLQEWALVELQGLLDTDSPTLGNEISGLELGTMHLNATGAPELIIGKSRLIGSTVALKKPLLVMNKNGNQNPEANATDSTNYEALGVIRQKYLFKQRPTPILKT